MTKRGWMKTGGSIERDRILIILQNRIARVKREMMERANNPMVNPLYELEDGGTRIKLLEEIIVEVMNVEIPD